MDENRYVILTFYCYTTIDHPAAEAKRHKKFLSQLDVRARIYIALNGINAQMSIAKDDASTYMQWLKEDERLSSILFKIDPYHEHVFPRLTVKMRKQLVALDQLPDLQLGGEHVPPQKWKEMLEQRDENTLLIDVRNDYESEIGHFEGAELPPLKKFRDFPEYAKQLATEKDLSKTKIMMYCTGGIRCETYSALLKEKGFTQVYQLEGGVIHYGHEMGNSYWKGKLFVFDDRLSVPISEDTHEIISICQFCQEKTDVYYNCANMDCNELFLSCLNCAKNLLGCCSQTCTQASRRRPFVAEERPKPFRKWYYYEETKSKDEHCCSCCS